MSIRTLTCIGVALGLLSAGVAFAQITGDVPAVRPDAIVNLATDEGVALVHGQWRYSDARVIEVEHRTHDITPHAGAADFDDAAWDAIAPKGLEDRRSRLRLRPTPRVNVYQPQDLPRFCSVSQTFRGAK